MAATGVSVGDRLKFKEDWSGKMASGKLEGPSAPALRRDPYEVLCVSRDSSDQEIKSAYRKLALKYDSCPLTFLILQGIPL